MYGFKNYNFQNINLKQSNVNVMQKKFLMTMKVFHRNKTISCRISVLVKCTKCTCTKIFYIPVVLRAISRDLNLYFGHMKNLRWYL